VKIAVIRNKLASKYLLLAFVALDLLLMALGRAPVLSIFISAGLLIYAFIRLLGLALHRSRMIWRLRSRLYVTYVFIGAVPIFLVLALSYLRSVDCCRPGGDVSVRAELSRRATTLTYPARVLSRARMQERAAILNEMAPLFHDREPGLEVLITNTNGEPDLRYPVDNKLPAPPDEWTDYTGLVRRGWWLLPDVACA